MAIYPSSWFFGSINFGSDQTFEISINGGAAVPIVFPSGDYYFDHSTTNLSLIKKLAALCLAGGSVGCTGGITSDGKAGLHSMDQPLQITWGTATALRNALGWDAASTSNSTTLYADDYSPIFWSPRAPATHPKTRDRVLGYKWRPDLSRTETPEGNKSIWTFHYEQTLQEATLEKIYIDQVWTTTDTNGTFKVFCEEVLMDGRNFFEVQDVQENIAATTTFLDWASAAYPLGPYQMRDVNSTQGWYNRVIANVDLLTDFTLPMIVVDEYS